MKSTAPSHTIDECIEALTVGPSSSLYGSVLHYLRTAQEERENLTAMISELHRMIGRGDHGNARDNHSCAVSGLIDILSASRENSLENAQLETELIKLKTELDRIHVIRIPIRPVPSKDDLIAVTIPGHPPRYYCVVETDSSAVMFALEHVRAMIARWEIQAGDGFTIRVELEKETNQ